MSGWSTSVLLVSPMRTTRTYECGRFCCGPAVHMKPIRSFATQPPVIRGSHRPSQSTLLGASDAMLAPVHWPTPMSHQLMVLLASSHRKRRSCVDEMWLPKYIVWPAPWVRRSEPLFVVVHELN